MKLFSIIITMSFFIASGAQASSLETQLQQLKSFSAKDLQEDKKRTDKSKLKIDEMFDTLEALNKTLEKEVPSVELLREACRVAELTYANDPTEYSAELLLPTYQRHKDLFLKVFTKSQYERCRSSLKNAEREEKSGNG